MNVFGERQHPEKYIPLCIRKILNNECISIHANKECTKAGSRFYIHAKEVCDAMFHILKLCLLPRMGGMWWGDKWNIVGSEEIDNLTLAKRISEIMGIDLNYNLVDFHSSRPGHDLRYALDGTKLTELGWTPNPLDDCLRATINWYTDPQNKEWLG